MEFTLNSKKNVFPCLVTIDEDNGRYTIRKADSCGEIFNTPEDLVSWVLTNWTADEFCNERDFETMITEIKFHYPLIS